MRDLLRLRRHVLDQVRRDLGAPCRQQVRAHRGGRRRRRRARRSRLHAEHRRPAAPARRHANAGAARGRGPRRRATSKPGSDDGDRAMQVASMHFKERAHDKLQRRAAADEPREDAGQVRHEAAIGDRRARRLRGHARGGARRSASARSTTSTSGSSCSSANATARGATVLCAETPADVNALVLEIAARHGVRKIIKSKSMVSEESALDHAIEARRHDGRRDRPRRVHPADQRLRAAVAHHRPGAAQVARRRSPSSSAASTARRSKDGIEELCLEARGVLREHYLTADMGISGGNFFVAETGSVVLVTNEGNATLATTLPQGPRRDLRHREDRADARGRRDADAPAAALGDRPVDLATTSTS